MEERLRQCADDLDDNERAHNDLANEIKTMKTVMIGVLVSTTTSALGLTLNLLFRSFG